MFQGVSGAHMSTPGHTDVVSGWFQGSRMKFRVFQVVSGAHMSSPGHSALMLFQVGFRGLG